MSNFIPILENLDEVVKILDTNYQNWLMKRQKVWIEL